MPSKTRRAGEFELIARYFAPLARGHDGALGLTDDAAYLRPQPGVDLVITTDAVVEGVHFLPDDPPDAVARKALRVNLSDLAAKGARPTVYLLDAVLPDTLDEAWLAGFANGLAKDQAEFAVTLVGGDMASTPGPLTLAITAIGEVESGRMLRRSGARPGDSVYVSGTIGDAALGLLARRGALTGGDARAREFLADRYRLPRPRVALGPRLVGLAHAALDVSDGLVADLAHICETSNVAAAVEEARVPLSAAASAALAAEGDLIDRVLGGGDDYEILFTAPPAADNTIAALAHELALPLTRIGAIEAGRGVRVMRADGTARPLEHRGWQHF